MSSFSSFNSLDISKYSFDKCFLRFERKMYNRKIDREAIVFAKKNILGVFELFLKSVKISHDKKETLIIIPSNNIVVFQQEPPNKDSYLASKNCILLKDLKNFKNNQHITGNTKEEMLISMPKIDITNDENKRNEIISKDSKLSIFQPQKILTNSKEEIDDKEDEKNRKEYMALNSKRIRKLSKKQNEEELKRKAKIEMKKFYNQTNNYQYTNDHNAELIFIKKPIIDKLPELESLSYFHIGKNPDEKIVQQKRSAKNLFLQNDNINNIVYQNLNSTQTNEKIEIDNTIYNEINPFRLSDGVSLYEIGSRTINYIPHKRNLHVC